MWRTDSGERNSSRKRRQAGYQQIECTGRRLAHIPNPGVSISHSSIVAGEYGIPAVVSVDGATLLTDWTLVTVDGYHGIVHKCPEQQRQREQRTDTISRSLIAASNTS